MHFKSLADFLAAQKRPIGPQAVAIIMAEDDVEIVSTLTHHLDQGVGTLILLAPPRLALPGALAQRILRIDADCHRENALPEAVNWIAGRVEAGTWIYAGYNAEYLYYPFCEHRRLGEMLAFHAEERRASMFCQVLDLYAQDLFASPSGVCRQTAHFDSTGYVASPRLDPDRDWAPMAQQVDLYGGLRSRFAEHVPWDRRRIDRIALFRAGPNRRLLADFTLSTPEDNSYACPWHHNLTAAVCSFRAAKALRHNPEARAAIQSFLWPHSAPFEWQSPQLLARGIIEAGQWF